MEPFSRVVGGFRVPGFLYGTAWKEERTRELVELALNAGFRGIDTANQRKHYHEAGVGEALERFLERGLATRDDLFLQTKFTSRDGQDHRLPYDPRAPIATQVEQSFASSLVHLRTSRIDSLVLHGPSLRRGLADADWEAWGAMEAIARRGDVRLLGVSNVSAEQLETLARDATIAPAFVQNRCYASLGWDRAVRRVAEAHSIVYQGFSLLTANRAELADEAIAGIAARHHATAAEVVFRFAIARGMLPLTGTSSDRHMRLDRAIDRFELDDDELRTIESIAGAGNLGA